MHRRRAFLTQIPVGLAGLVSACRPSGGDAGTSTPGTAATTARSAASGSTAAGAARPAPLPLEIPAAAPTLRWVPEHSDLVYTFGGAAAKHRIIPGTRIVSWTEDCFDGAVKTASDLASKVMAPGHDNPQTGPFHIEGAEPGDTVAVHLLKIEPARSYGVSAVAPRFGALVSTDRTAMLAADLPETTWRYDLDDARTTARSSSRDGQHTWEVPLAPFLGCLGVAPAAAEVRSTIVPGPFGGNMDCPEVRAGNTVFLGVNVAGALLSFGDGHYAMGDGEIIGAAVEGAMNVELFVELVKRTATPVPRIENADEVMFVGSGRPLEDAARVAFTTMVYWVRERSGMSELDAYQFVSQTARAPIIQLVDPEYTVLVKIEKARVPQRRSS